MRERKESLVSVEEAGKRIAEFVEQVAREGSRVVMTSDGKPVAAIVGVEDYLKIGSLERKAESRRKEMIREIESHRKAILERRQGAPIEDVVALVRDVREERSDELIERLSNRG